MQEKRCIATHFFATCVLILNENWPCKTTFGKRGNLLSKVLFYLIFKKSAFLWKLDIFAEFQQCFSATLFLIQMSYAKLNVIFMSQSLWPFYTVRHSAIFLIDPCDAAEFQAFSTVCIVANLQMTWFWYFWNFHV